MTMVQPGLRRYAEPETTHTLSDLPLLLQRLYRHRGVQHPHQLARDLAALLPPSDLLNATAAAELLLDVFNKRQRIVIVGDFDADGATSTAVAMLGLQLLGHENVFFIVPNRFQYGYGLTPPIVEMAQAQGADLIITVDNGIASLAGVAAAKALGMRVLITDHHLPGHELPDADVIVNPNQTDCCFSSKAMAGVGVMFYVLLATRRLMRERGMANAEVNLAQLLDLVTLGTVADVVAFDRNNRILVHQGLQRIRQGQCRPGIQALLQLARRDHKKLSATDLAFSVAPRLNAAGRLDDMALGIKCLLATTAAEAMPYALELERLNNERKQIEETMLADADEIIATHVVSEGELRFGLCLYDEQWHQGVIGLIAGRVKEKFYRPSVCFAPGTGDEVKGSARSIPGVHIRDVLAHIANLHPGLLSKFGGHAMAAGMSLQRQDLDRFSSLFDDTVRAHLNQVAPTAELWSDGELSSDELTLSTAQLIRQAGPWGQHFPEPVFDGEFDVMQQRLLGEKHIKLKLRHGDGLLLDAIAFDAERKGWQPQTRVCCAYKLDINEYNGNTGLQLMIERFF